MRVKLVLVAAVASACALLVAPTWAGASTAGATSAGASGAGSGVVAPEAVPAAAQALPSSLPAVATRYTPVTPCRVFDTRTSTPLNRCANATALVSAFKPIQTRAVQLSSINSLLIQTGVVPSTASAVVINLTAVNSTARTFLTVYPSDQSRPIASSLNLTSPLPVANLVTVQLGLESPVGSLITTQGIKIYNDNGTVDVIADLEGYFTPLSGSGYTPAAPCRIFDTRGPVGLCSGAATVRKAKIGPGASLTVKVTGLDGISAANVTAVVLNLTAVNATGRTYEKAYPTGSAAPLASNLNVNSALPVANLVTVKVGTGGRITIYNFGGQVDLLADLAGYYTSSGGKSYYPITPCRAVDSRIGHGDCTPNSLPVLGALQATIPVQLLMLGVGPLPASVLAPIVSAVTFNLTVVNATKPTYFTVFPADHTRPLASNINVPNANPLSNQVIVGLGALGTGKAGVIQVQNAAGSAQFIMDIAGYYL
jgi:hypothetical protein